MGKRLIVTISGFAGVLLVAIAASHLLMVRFGTPEPARLTFGYSDASQRACPEGFVLVPSDDDFVDFDFCVMKYEAKAFDTDAGRVIADGCGNLSSLADCNLDAHHNWADLSRVQPRSLPDGAPWRRVSFNDAYRACAGLGPGFRLITNREWMAIARDVEQVGANWSGTAAGEGTMAKGLHKVPGISDDLYKLLNHPAPDASAGCLYAESQARRVQCKPRGEVRYRRTLVLSTGDVLWDMAGNVWLWVDAAEDGSAIDGDVCGNDDTWNQFPACELRGLYKAATEPDSIDKRFEILPALALDPSSGVGMVNSSQSNDAVFRRGGSWVNQPAAGVFGLDLRSSPFGGGPMMGFRCTSRSAPPPGVALQP